MLSVVAYRDSSVPHSLFPMPFVCTVWWLVLSVVYLMLCHHGRRLASFWEFKTPPFSLHIATDSVIRRLGIKQTYGVMNDVVEFHVDVSFLSTVGCGYPLVEDLLHINYVLSSRSPSRTCSFCPSPSLRLIHRALRMWYRCV